MIDCDYYVVQAPMTVDLNLKGYDLTVFAVIYGFTKDGLHRYRGSAETIAEKWLGDRKKARAVKDSIRVLAEAGYINVYKERSGRREYNTYDTNYKSLLEDVEAGRPIPALGRKMRGKTLPDSGIIPPVVSTRETRGIIPPEPVVLYHPISIINIYKYFSLRANPATLEEEQQQVYILFFWKGAKAPAVEVAEFYRYNTANGWKDGKGRQFDTWEKRLALADGWDFKKGGAGRADEKFLKAWRRIWREAKERGDKFAPRLMDERTRCQKAGPDLRLYCRHEVYNWIEGTKDETGATVGGSRQHVFPILRQLLKEYRCQNLRYVFTDEK